MKLLIIGNARHGKDTVAEYISKKYGLRYKTTSMLAAEKIIMPGLPGQYSSVEECFEDRVNHRSKWFDLIYEYNKDDPTRFVRDVFQDNDIFCGLRNGIEFQALRKVNAFDLCIWVENPYLEDENQASMTIARKYADISLDNSGSLEDLYSKLDRLFACFDEFLLHPKNYDFI